MSMSMSMFNGQLHPRDQAGRFARSDGRPNATKRTHAAAKPAKARDNSELFGRQKSHGPGFGGTLGAAGTPIKGMQGD